MSEKENDHTIYKEKKNQLTNLKGSDDNKSFEHTSTESSYHSTMMTQIPRLRVLKRRLQDRIGTHPQRVFERQMCGKRRQSLPESPKAFVTHDGGAAVDDAFVSTGTVQLEPGFDDVDRLQAGCLHYSPQ